MYYFFYRLLKFEIGQNKLFPQFVFKAKFAMKIVFDSVQSNTVQFFKTLKCIMSCLKQNLLIYSRKCSV